MVSLNECIDMSELSEDEISVIADQEHLTPMVAAELGFSLLQTPRGVHRLHQIFRDRLANLAGTHERVKEKLVARIYARFRADHPVPRVL